MINRKNSKSAFDQKLFDFAYPPGIKNHYWNLARNFIVLHELKSRGLKRTIEIGCGLGIVVGFLRENGYDCSGVELAPIALSDDLNSHIKTGIEAEKLPLEERIQFDSILLLDVLEHIPDPKKFLIRIAESFPAASKIIISVPSRAEIWSNYDEYYGHFRRYDSKSLREDCEIRGWSIESIKYAYKLLYFPALLMKILKKERNIIIRSPMGLSKIFHQLLAKIIYYEYLLTPKFIFGTSLICVMKINKKIPHI